MKLKITQIADVGTKGMVVNCTCMDEQGTMHQFRGWKSKQFETHDEFRDYHTEVKEDTYNGQTRSQAWIDKPKEFKTNRGAANHAAKAEQESKRIDFEREKQAQFQEKWSVDREMEAKKQSSIMAQVCLKSAIELHISELNALGGEVDLNKVSAYSQDLAAALQITHAQIFNQFKAGAL